MVKEAAEAGIRTNVQARDWILAKYPGTNPNTVFAQINLCSVNSPSRIHYPENQQVRAERSRVDTLYKTGRGTFEPYDPAKHGTWLIRRSDRGQFEIYRADHEGQVGGSDQEAEAESQTGLHTGSTSEASYNASTFAAEAHLRDYLASNLHVIEEGLQPYGDEFGSSHVEFRTEVGPIDILCIDRDGGILVVELKVDRSSDAVAGQILRYVNWVRRHLADGRPVRGIIIAKAVSSKLLYSIDSDPTIAAREYDLEVKLKPPLKALPSANEPELRISNE